MMVATGNQDLPAVATPTISFTLFSLALPPVLLLLPPHPVTVAEGFQQNFSKNYQSSFTGFWQVMETLKNFQNFHSKML